ncbi:MAG: DUF1883 domain-containing protein [Candidatus Cloacimonadota bacterium]|nr:MAG: DUF1883 domain-containing protein [Candidatus Cloacimonadota bacterium]
MSFLHSREYINEGDVVEVMCSHQCNILLLTDTNFQNYKNNRRYSYSNGGFYKMFPARMQVPNTGYWNIVLFLAGGSARIKHTIKIIKK